MRFLKCDFYFVTFENLKHDINRQIDGLIKPSRLLPFKKCPKNVADCKTRKGKKIPRKIKMSKIKKWWQMTLTVHGHPEKSAANQPQEVK